MKYHLDEGTEIRDLTPQEALLLVQKKHDLSCDWYWTPKGVSPQAPKLIIFIVDEEDDDEDEDDENEFDFDIVADDILRDMDVFDKADITLQWTERQKQLYPNLQLVY